MKNKLFLLAIVAAAAASSVTSFGFVTLGDYRKSMDMYTDKNGNLVVVMRIPGIIRDKIKISIEQTEKGEKLRVSGENKKEQMVSKKDYYRQELKYGHFERVITLPYDVDAEKTTARLHDGILTITMPPAEGMGKKVKKVTVVRI